jgi:hypothetical protein
MLLTFGFLQGLDRFSRISYDTQISSKAETR